MTKQPVIECPHCGADIEGLCGHPAMPAPCWAPEHIENYRRALEKRHAAEIGK